MNRIEFEKLLSEVESERLDFKLEQYRFYNLPRKDEEREKSELLKDILAFANAARKETAYILIGIREKDGRAIELCGISQHLQGHHLQQFVNSKTNVPIRFEYMPYVYDRCEIGIIRIPVQIPPVYLNKDYGSLRAKAVYARQGSTTIEADPMQISRMAPRHLQEQFTFDRVEMVAYQQTVASCVSRGVISAAIFLIALFSGLWFSKLILLIAAIAAIFTMYYLDLAMGLKRQRFYMETDEKECFESTPSGLVYKTGYRIQCYCGNAARLRWLHNADGTKSKIVVECLINSSHWIDFDHTLLPDL